MKDTDFTIHQGWMISKLHLTGPSRDLYSLIYGYTKDGQSWYEANVANIQEWLGMSERTVQRHLRQLEMSGYILRRQTGLGRSSRLLLQANPDILEKVGSGAEFYPQKGDNSAPIKRVTKTTKKGDNLTPLASKKGDKNDNTPYIRIKEIKDNKRILLSACTRTKEEEEFFEIFFFKGAADPAAEVTDFVNWYEANYPEWREIPVEKKYYYASVWKIEPERKRKVSAAWLSAWADVCNWIRENDPAALALMLDTRFTGRCYTDSMEGGRRTYELIVTRAAATYLCDHHATIVKPFLSPLAQLHGADKAKWNIIDKS